MRYHQTLKVGECGDTNAFRKLKCLFQHSFIMQNIAECLSIIRITVYMIIYEDVWFLESIWRVLDFFVFCAFDGSLRPTKYFNEVEYVVLWK